MRKDENSQRKEKVNVIIKDVEERSWATVGGTQEKEPKSSHRKSSE